MSTDAPSPEWNPPAGQGLGGDADPRVYLGHRPFTHDEIAADRVRVLQDGVLWRIVEVDAAVRLVTYVHEPTGELRRHHADYLTFIDDPTEQAWRRRADPSSPSEHPSSCG